MIEVTTDEYSYNNGNGVTASWTCVNSGNEMFMVDKWEGASDVWLSFNSINCVFNGAFIVANKTDRR